MLLLHLFRPMGFKARVCWVGPQYVCTPARHVQLAVFPLSCTQQVNPAQHVDSSSPTRHAARLFAWDKPHKPTTLSANTPRDSNPCTIDLLTGLFLTPPITTAQLMHLPTHVLYSFLLPAWPCPTPRHQPGQHQLRGLPDWRTGRSQAVRQPHTAGGEQGPGRLQAVIVMMELWWW